MTSSDHKQPIVVAYSIYDARGNGEGGVAPTITGDHENRVTDYTAIAVLGNSNSNAAILTDDTSPTLLGIRGGGTTMCQYSCWAIDSHPEDSRMRIVNGALPSLTVKMAKLASDGPLVLMRKDEWNADTQ